ncbi:ankyrin repeat domain-containing protein [Ideonella azotifigens]|uniref:Ankyrin repeat domain-containing protein n=1 Tax=Ideonella azotifigens TaxID=513160 RepID=A0ABN1K9B7_9BURK|nr:ankyrin repeat domain-containing protein [Ideonella azotifigens]MCD2342833.1 ankyrin repeat domain-containing protein [Ideonella azotifigens]
MKRRELLKHGGLAAMAATGLMVGQGAQADSYSDFFLYIELDRPEGLQKLLRAGFDVNSRNPKGQHGLYMAFRNDSEKAAELLLGWPGLDPEGTNAQGETLLMMAAMKGQIDAMKKLIALGAAVNRKGWTPLHYAASGGQQAAIILLLSHGAELEARGPNGNTPLMMAAGYGTIDSARLLLSRGADPKLVDGGDRHASDYARKAGHEGLAKDLEALAAKPG